jgi:hypothetical protein
MYILLIIEHNGDVSSDKESWNNALTHGRTGAVNYVQDVSEIGGHILDSCSIDHNKANII